jgi:1-acyl-sn-glycerol-3-phosphate acyltransferase
LLTAPGLRRALDLRAAGRFADDRDLPDERAVPLPDFAPLRLVAVDPLAMSSTVTRAGAFAPHATRGTHKTFRTRVTGDRVACHALAMFAPSRKNRTPAPAIWRTMQTLDRGLVAFAGRLEITGGVPDSLRGQPLLMAANHIGVFDAFVLIAACHRIGIAPRFLLAGGLLDAPVVGPALRASGHLRIDRGKPSAIEQFGQATEALRATRAPIIVYPEGRISHDPGLWPERGKTGAARLALAAGVPVVPISQWGAHEAVYWGTETVTGPADLVPLARSGFTSPLRRPRFQVHFGKPVDLAEFPPDKPGSGVRAHAKIMRAIVDGLAPLRPDEPGAPKFHDPTRPTDTVSPWKP